MKQRVVENNSRNRKIKYAQGSWQIGKKLDITSWNISECTFNEKEAIYI